MREKNPWIAFLLPLVPLLLIGFGLVAQRLKLWELGLVLISLGFLFGWGWGYVYLGHTLRAVASFFTGYLIGFSVFIVALQSAASSSSPRNQRLEDFVTIFLWVIGGVVVAAGIGLAVDAVRLARQHNRSVRKSRPV